MINYKYFQVATSITVLILLIIVCTSANASLSPSQHAMSLVDERESARRGFLISIFRARATRASETKCVRKYRGKCYAVCPIHYRRFRDESDVIRSKGCEDIGSICCVPLVTPADPAVEPSVDSANVFTVASREGFIPDDISFTRCVFGPVLNASTTDERYKYPAGSYIECEDVCYSSCYHMNSDHFKSACAYDLDQYKTSATELRKNYTKDYIMEDWSGAQITGRVRNANLLTGFIQLTNRKSSPGDSNMHNMYRMSIQIGKCGEPVERSKALWEVVEHLLKNFSPQWMKVDTPTRERTDSIIMAHGYPTYRDESSRISKLYSEIAASIKKAFVSSGKISNTKLPVFQYKSEGYITVADYAQGDRYSFGELLCKSACNSLDAGTFLDEWIRLRHPVSGRWEFKQPLTR